MFAIKSVSDEGVYYLVNGWRKHKTFWIDRINHKTLFKTESACKSSLTKLLKVMDDYLEDKFFIVEIDDKGIVNEKPYIIEYRMSICN